MKKLFTKLPQLQACRQHLVPTAVWNIASISRSSYTIFVTQCWSFHRIKKNIRSRPQANTRQCTRKKSLKAPPTIFHLRWRSQLLSMSSVRGWWFINHCLSYTLVCSIIISSYDTPCHDESTHSLSQTWSENILSRTSSYFLSNYNAIPTSRSFYDYAAAANYPQIIYDDQAGMVKLQYRRCRKLVNQQEIYLVRDIHIK